MLLPLEPPTLHACTNLLLKNASEDQARKPEYIAMTHPLIREVRSALKKAADPEKAPQMQAYMKSAMRFHGVSGPIQKSLWRTIFTAHPLTAAAWSDVALTLWREAAFREERYAAIALTDLARYKPYRDRSALPMLEEMIVSGAWWDLVDPLATHHLGDVLRTDRRGVSTLMRRWADDADMWKRRAAILCQIRFKRDTDTDLLYACIEPNLAHTDFFIRKAIGWALRQYAWTDPKAVTRYVNANRDRLSGLSVREALKNI
jgi:3-methyladenine DNA glycosylase AlkD